MGRGPLTEPQIDAGHIRASFMVAHNSGELLRRDRPCDSGGYNAKFAGESATYRDPDGVLRVRLRYRGKKRTMSAGRIAWIVHFGAYPTGQVQTRDGGDDLRPENLILTPHCAHRPQSKAGRASALERRRGFSAALISAMAEHQGAGVAQLATIIGSSESCVSTRLSKLQRQGLTCGPQCCPGKAWALSQAGREAAAGRPLLDDLDRDILRIVAQTPSGIVTIARRAGVCPLTARRRLGLLTGKGLVFADPRKFFSITPAGVAAGDAPQRQPWVNPERIKASTAKDVVGRTYLDDRAQAERSRPGQMARAAAKRNRSNAFNPWFEERLAG
jgi:hypothetical protein